MSRSIRSRRNQSGRNLIARLDSGLQNPTDRLRQTLPIRDLPSELLVPLACQAIHLRAAALLGVDPFGGQQALLLESVQSRIERALRHLQQRALRLVDLLSYRVTVQR